MGKDGRLTIKDIAGLAGVSKTTVSFYLNGKTDKMSEETRSRLETIIRDHHYQPNIAARIVNQKKSGLIGVIIGDITNSFSNQIVKGIEDTASAKGYQMLIGNSNYSADGEAGYVSKMLTLGVDGFIIQPGSRFEKTQQQLLDSGKPLVYFDSKLYEACASWVKTDNYEATYHAIEVCIRRGYRRFLMIGADPQLLSTRIERSSGFLDAVRAHGLPCHSLEIAEQRMDPESILGTVRSMLSDEEPLLVYVPNCWALPAVFTALHPLRGRMPEALGLIGFDNTEWTQLSEPRVSTIVQPAYAEGETACRILIGQIEEQNGLSTQEILPCTVNWEDSTRKACNTVSGENE